MPKKKRSHHKVHVIAELKQENIVALKQAKRPLLVVQAEGLAAMTEIAREEPVVVVAVPKSKLPKSWADKAADWLLGTSEPPTPGDEPF